MQVKVIYVQRGADPDLMVKGPDSRHVLVAMSWTDYAGSLGQEPDISPSLLEIEGLRQAARFMEGLRRDERYPPPEKRRQVADHLPKPMLDRHKPKP